jgi:hypothetical protein
MELSPSWEAASCASTQELPNILRNPKIHYRVHENLPLVPILSQIDPFHINHSHLSFLLTFPPISYMHSSSPHLCYMPCPSLPPWLEHSNYTWRTVQVMKLLIMQFSPTFCYFNSLWSKYSPQHPVPPNTNQKRYRRSDLFTPWNISLIWRKSKITSVRFGFLMAVNVQIGPTIFWDVMPCIYYLFVDCLTTVKITQNI